MNLTDHLNLTENPEHVSWPETHYVFVERVGPFMETAGQAWQKAHSFVPALTAKSTIAKYMSLYKIGLKIYRAGFALTTAPVDLPEGLTYEKFAGGKYVRFVLTGPFTQLPEASRRAWEIVEEKKIDLRDDFAIENYLNDPSGTPEEKLQTEILIPTE